jgi:hypothetical protein
VTIFIGFVLGESKARFVRAKIGGSGCWLLAVGNYSYSVLRLGQAWGLGQKMAYGWGESVLSPSSIWCLLEGRGRLHLPSSAFRLPPSVFHLPSSIFRLPSLLLNRDIFFCHDFLPRFAENPIDKGFGNSGRRVFGQHQEWPLNFIFTGENLRFVASNVVN